MGDLKESEVDSVLLNLGTEKTDQPRNARIHRHVPVQRSKQEAKRI
jgi:hypothetical protein